MKHLRMLAAAAVLGATVLPAAAVDISGAGATFPYPIYAKWADAYKKETGVGLNYQSIGSGGGIKQIKAKTVTFGASDMPLKAEELKKDGLIQFPTVMGGVVPVVNLEGVKPGELMLDGPTLAKIFLGEIKSWDDAGDQEAQPESQSARAGDRRRAPFGWLRHDLHLRPTICPRSAPDWKTKVGANTSVEWPAGIGAKGNEGVANNVEQTKGAIGYVEYAYAKQNKLTYTKMINKDGKTVAPTAESFQAAAANADWGRRRFLRDPDRQPGANTGRSPGATFILIYKQPDDPAAAAEALKFFAWAYAKGDKMAEELDYVPMPDKVVGAIEKMWASEIKDAGGKPLYTAM